MTAAWAMTSLRDAANFHVVCTITHRHDPLFLLESLSQIQMKILQYLPPKANIYTNVTSLYNNRMIYSHFAECQFIVRLRNN